MIGLNSGNNRWCFITAICVLIGLASTETDVRQDNSKSVEGWPEDLQANASRRTQLMNLEEADDRICSSKSIYDEVVGKDEADTAGVQWWLERCGGKKPEGKVKGTRRRRRAKPLSGFPPAKQRKIRQKVMSLIKKMNCNVKTKMVELSQELGRDVRYNPPCVPVKRCSGCCDSLTHECQPTKVTQKKFTVIFSDNTGSELFETFRLDVHKHCQCGCKVRAEHCNTTVHRYDDGRCQCVCLSPNRGCPQGKKWDEKECACVCENIECSEGRHLNKKRCKCV